jgi:hypothetical protein
MPGRALILSRAAALLLAANLGGVGQEQPALRERIAVVNVEVPVRVIGADGPLVGLGKGDFRLFEDGVPQAINGFSLRRKRMRVQQVSLAAEAGAAPPPRYFVLCFRISDFNGPLRAGLDYFFSHILRDTDQLLAFANERSLLLDRHLGQARRQQILERVLSDEAVRARQELEAYCQRLRHDIDPNRLRALIEGNRQSFTVPQIINFLEAYLVVCQEFRKKYLLPDLDKFYDFARHLQKIDGEKWVLNFYQVEMFPRLRISGSLRRLFDELIDQLTNSGGAAEQLARVIQRSLAAIDRGVNAADGFPSEQIGKMLIRVGTTYHCFISGVRREGISDDLEYKQVASDLEQSLREITRCSGGEVVLSGDIGSALHVIEDKEDAYYVLTYEPRDPARRGRIRVEVSEPSARLLYDDQVRTDTIAAYLEARQAQEPTLQLERLAFSAARLQLEIASFKTTTSRRGKSGQLHVAVSVRDADERTVYEQGRTLEAREDRVALAIAFPFLKPGRHLFLVTVRDLLTGKTAMDVLVAQVE